MSTYQSLDDLDLQAKVNADLRGVSVMVDRYDLPEGKVMHGLVFCQGSRRGITQRAGMPYNEAEVSEIVAAARRWADQPATMLTNRWVDDVDEADAQPWLAG